jgi:glutamate-1-semialdehyde 2,1-aminomutase
MHASGSSAESLGIKPDLAAFSKAIGNGHAISCCVGRSEHRIPASKVFLTGSFWNAAVSMAAAIATLDEFDRSDALSRMNQMGQLLADGLTSLAKDKGLSVKLTGPASMPFFRFANETNFKRCQLFCSEMSMRGVFFHPSHNWFLSAAHTEDDIHQTLDKASGAFDAVKSTFGD